jgi:hypothetical protein
MPVPLQLTLVVGKSRQQWAAEINEAYDHTVEGYQKIARLLVDAREGPGKLPHGDFEAMVKTDLKFDPSTARMLMAVAKDLVLSNREHAHVLPSSWDTRYRLSRLPKDVKEAKIADGTIHPGMQRKDAQALLLQYLPPPKPRPRKTSNPDDREQFFGVEGACALDVQRIASEALQKIPAAEHARLFLVLRHVLDELEKKFAEETEA